MCTTKNTTLNQLCRSCTCVLKFFDFNENFSKPLDFCISYFQHNFTLACLRLRKQATVTS